MDVLDSLLEIMRPRGTVVGRSWQRSPWGIAFPSAPWVHFNLILDGECWLRAPDLETPLRLARGDLALILTDTAHELVSGRGVRAQPIAQVMPRVRAEQRRPLRRRGAGTLVFWGTYYFQPSLISALTGLPRVVHLPAARIATEAGARAAIDALVRELDRPGPGHQSTIDKLVDLLLVYALRCCAMRDDAGAVAWITALRQPALGQAIAAIHRAPERDWSVADLARAAGMSRAAFADAFARNLRRAPIAYLTQWRMTVASALLRDTGLSLAEIAARVGYKNPYAFSSAFKRVTGHPPGRQRRLLRRG